MSADEPARVKPIVILQHAPDVGPGYFTQWLESQRLPYTLLDVERDAVPQDSGAFAGVCSLGGPMSVNDRLPWIEQECELIGDAVARGVPVIGHCLGGQLLARALGADVTRQPVKEIGWADVAITDRALARDWLGTDAPGAVRMFHWHEDAFALPAGARNFMATPSCAHQAYVVERAGVAHLGMQFHCEMTPELVRAWALDPEWNSAVDIEQAAGRGATVQAPAQLVEDLDARTQAMNAWAARLYARWARGLRSA